MTVTAEVVQLGQHWYCLCRACEWRSAPQESQSDALDRAVVHDFFNHDDDDPRPPRNGEAWLREALLHPVEESSW